MVDMGVEESSKIEITGYGTIPATSRAKELLEMVTRGIVFTPASAEVQACEAQEAIDKNASEQLRGIVAGISQLPGKPVRVTRESCQQLATNLAELTKYVESSYLYGLWKKDTTTEQRARIMQEHFSREGFFLFFLAKTTLELLISGRILGGMSFSDLWEEMNRDFLPEMLLETNRRADLECQIQKKAEKPLTLPVCGEGPLPEVTVDDIIRAFNDKEIYGAKK